MAKMIRSRAFKKLKIVMWIIVILNLLLLIGIYLFKKIAFRTNKASGNVSPLSKTRITTNKMINSDKSQPISDKKQNSDQVQITINKMQSVDQVQITIDKTSSLKEVQVISHRSVSEHNNKSFPKLTKILFWIIFRKLQ